MVFVTSRRMWAKLTRVFLVVLLAVLLAGGVVYYQNSRPTAQANAGGEKAAPAATLKAADPVPSGPVSPSQSGGNGTAVVLPPLPPAGGAKGTVKLAAVTTPPPAAPPAIAGDAPKSPSSAPKAAPLADAEVAKLLADAQAKFDANDALGVRTILNDAIVGDRLPAAAAEQARGMQSHVNEKLVFSPQVFPGDTYVDTALIERSDSLRAIARQHAVPWEGICRINGVSDKRIRVGKSLKAPVGPFHVVVNKSAFRLDLLLGGLPGEATALYVTSLPVGLGKDNSTPVGTWEVVLKAKNPPWTNPRSGEHYEGYDPKNPLGGYWVALKGVEGDTVGKTGYGIHGTTDPDSIGKQASMGCVRLRVDDIQLVYDLVTEKSRVLVKE